MSILHFTSFFLPLSSLKHHKMTQLSLCSIENNLIVTTLDIQLIANSTSLGIHHCTWHAFDLVDPCSIRDLCCMKT